MRDGRLVISLDFELIWGVFDHVSWQKKTEYFLNTRKLIPEVLKLFEAYEVSCTWATVGMLFNENWDEWNNNIPEVLPNYEQEYLSAYKFGKENQTTDIQDLCFAPELIKKINDTPKQEIATHTYSHYYCLENGQTGDSFEADLRGSLKMAKKFGIELKSLVFPRNQFNSEYLAICKKLGIENVRSNPETWFWENTESNSLINKIFRTGDAYLGPVNKSYKLDDIVIKKEHPFSQKASRLLRPYTTKRSLNRLKLNRIKTEMSKAAKSKEIYHLWWHPHNFGDHPLESIRDLKEILSHFQTLKMKFNFQSQNMDEVGKLIRN